VGFLFEVLKLAFGANLDDNLALPLIEPFLPPFRLVSSGFFGNHYACMADLDCNFSFTHVQVSSDRDGELIPEISRAPRPGFILDIRREISAYHRLVWCKLPDNHGLRCVQISTIAHATDDLDKVQSALHSILPETLKRSDIFTRRYMQGHHGNPIVTFEAKLTKRQEIDQFIDHFTRHLAKNEKLLIERDLDMHTDEEGNLYVRLHKQQAYRGRVELGDEDPIRLRLKFTRLSGEARELMKKFLESR
jgi:RNA binding exosome subunit